MGIISDVLYYFCLVTDRIVTWILNIKSLKDFPQEHYYKLDSVIFSIVLWVGMPVIIVIGIISHISNITKFEKPSNPIGNSVKKFLFVKPTLDNAIIAFSWLMLVIWGITTIGLVVMLNYRESILLFANVFLSVVLGILMGIDYAKQSRKEKRRMKNRTVTIEVI